MRLVFREPADSNELESMFHLRHIAYAEDPQLYKMISSDTHLDINSFDRKALHFAGFDGAKPVAYMRIVTSSESKFSEWVDIITARNKIHVERDLQQFPFQTYCTDKEWSLRFIEGLKGRKIGEVGKLAIDTAHRKGGVVLKQLIESFIHYCKAEQKFDIGFGSCILSLERYYRQFGFERAAGSVPFIYDSLPEAVMVKFDR